MLRNQYYLCVPRKGVRRLGYFLNHLHNEASLASPHKQKKTIVLRELKGQQQEKEFAVLSNIGHYCCFKGNVPQKATTHLCLFIFTYSNTAKQTIPE